jgi:hypothetical protein
MPAANRMRIDSLSLILQALNERSQNESCWRMTYRPIDEHGHSRNADAITLCYENLVDFPFDTVHPVILKWRGGNHTVRFVFSTNMVDVQTSDYNLFTQLYPLLRNASVSTINLTMTF